MKHNFLLLGFLLFATNYVLAQINVRDSATQALHLYVGGSAYATGADLNTRYGMLFSADASLGFKTKKNWLFGTNFSYFFSNNVKNTFGIYGSQLTEQGYFIGNNGAYATIEFFMRGYYLGGYIGKILPLLNHNPSSGLFVNVGGGFVQSKIFVRNPEGSYPQYQGEYGKGYDRLHNGFALTQQIGYLHSGNRRMVNYALSLVAMQGFTKNVREYNWDTRMPDTAPKTDLYFGLKLQWFLPIYSKNAQKFYYY